VFTVLTTYIDLASLYQYYDIKIKMNNFKNKETNLNKLIEKLGNLSVSYTQSNNEAEKITQEKNQLEGEKKEVELKHDQLLKEHKYLKNKLLKLQEEVSKKSEKEEIFNREIDELSQETENLVEDIEKWQM
jgi:chromosome segregation ATPase